MKIDRNLNLVMKIADGDGEVAVFSSPISAHVFDRHWELFRAVYDDMESGNWSSSMVLARRILQKVAKSSRNQAAATEVINAITSQTFAALPIGDVMISNADVPDDVLDEAINRLIFFTVKSPFIAQEMGETYMTALAEAWNAEFTRLGFTEWLNSSTTATTGGSISGTPIPSLPA